MLERGTFGRLRARVGRTQNRVRTCGYLALYENFWPETDASYITPPFAIVNTATPFW
jgi:hypothetical protein